MTIPIAFDESALQAFCKRWGVKELDLFGSVLRDDFRLDSDVDVLATLEEDHRPTLLTLAQMEDELQVIFGRRVDLVLHSSLEGSKNYIRREHILAHRLPVYVAR